MGELFLILSSILLASIGQILLKQGANQIGGFNWSLTTILHLLLNVYSNIFILSGIVFYGVSSFLWILALTKTELSYAYPMVAISYVLVSVMSWIIFKDDLSLTRSFALVIIILGVILLSRS